MVNWLNTKWFEDTLKFSIGVLILVIANQWSAQFFSRFDLTEEKRYSIKPASKEILESLDDKIYVDVYLEGDLNSSFKRFQKSIKETLQEFELYSNGKVVYNFIDPGTALSQNARNEFMSELASKGIQPTNIIDTRDGQRTEKIIFPGAVVSYGTAEKGVMLLRGFKAR
ncbi:MAG: Gldg family protein, partial [Cyclobacteriaceae bacterium]|nr:Gldg family protein [Cyclobacteriaceae bacterium]